MMHTPTATAATATVNQVPKGSETGGIATLPDSVARPVTPQSETVVGAESSLASFGGLLALVLAQGQPQSAGLSDGGAAPGPDAAPGRESLPETQTPVGELLAAGKALPDLGQTIAAPLPVTAEQMGRTAMALESRPAPAPAPAARAVLELDAPVPRQDSVPADRSQSESALSARLSPVIELPTALSNSARSALVPPGGAQEGSEQPATSPDVRGTVARGLEASSALAELRSATGTAGLAGAVSEPTLTASRLPPAQVSPTQWQAAQAHVTERVVWFANNNVHTAQLQLNPPELGGIDVKLSVKEGELKLELAVGQTWTRDLFEANLPRLRESLIQAGFAEPEVNVSHQESRSDTESAGADPNSEQAEEQDASRPQPVLDTARHARGLIDSYV